MNKMAIFFGGFLMLSLCVSCETENEIKEVANIESQKALRSPNGDILVSSEDELVELYLLRTKQTEIKDKNTINIQEISYDEKESYSIAFIDLLDNGTMKKMLVVFSEKVSHNFFQDSNNLYIIPDNKKPSNEKSTEGVLNITNFYAGKNTLHPMLRGTFVCNGGCCEWSNPSPNAYHCGCPAAKPAGPDPDPIIFTSSDGCEIQYL